MTEKQRTKMRELGEQARQRGIKKRKEILEKKKKQGLKPRMIGPVLEDLCQMHSITYFDSWTSKLYGMAKNWLKETADQGIDPAVMLDKLVSNWPELRLHAKRDDGKQLGLRQSVNFEQFYKYRRQIIDWLENPDMDMSDEALSKRFRMEE